MQVQLMETYAELMAALDELPEDIADLQYTVTDQKVKVTENARHLENLERITIEKAGGWASLGSNEGARKTALQTLLHKSSAYMAARDAGILAERHLVKLQDDLADLERRYGSVCYAAQLHGAMLTYLGRGGAPTAEMPMPAVRTNGRGEVEFMPSAADAEAIGL